MSKIAYCATWANGISADPLRSAFLQESSLESFRHLLQRIGNVILGSQAYTLLSERGIDFSKHRLVILSSQSEVNSRDGIQVAQSPVEALSLFPSVHQQSGVLVGGGIKTISSFIQQNLINELLIDIEPALSTDTIQLFPTLTKKIDLELVGVRKIGAGTIQLHYRFPTEK